jgi:ankyrin repeat protein
MNNFENNLKNAIACNNVDFLKKNINQFNIDYRFFDEDDDTLLLYAISDKGSKAYAFFLNNGSNTNLVNIEGEGVIHAIVYSGDIERLLEFMKSYTFDINLRALDGSTPLLLSISIEKYEMAKVLIEAGADVNIGDNEDNTPLHVASWFGNLEMVKLLINRGANQHKKTKKGNYPVALAINGDYTNVAKFLFATFYPQTNG